MPNWTTPLELWISRANERNAKRRALETIKNNLTNQYYGYAEGREFNSWITGRGNSAGDLITNPVHIIESIIRDEKHSEINLLIVPVTTYTCQVDRLRETKADYYNGATIVNITKNESDTIFDFAYTGGHKVVATVGAHEGWESGDKCFVYNIQPGIDTTNFDATKTTRASWVFARYINEKIDFRDLLSSLCLESNMIYYKSYTSKRLIPLDYKTADGTFSLPLGKGTKKAISCKMTSIDNIYSEFILNYAYDFAKGLYAEKHFVNKNEDSDSGLDGYKSLCDSVESNYKITGKKLEINADNIYDSATAILLLRKIILWHTKQFLQVNYSGDIKNHIVYECGDQVLINDTSHIPAGLNNNANFIICEEKIGDSINQKIDYILLELPTDLA